MKKSWNYPKLSFLAVLVLAILFLTGCSLLPSESDSNTESAPTAVPERVAENDTNVSEGSVVPRDSAYLAFPLPGEIAEVLFAEGDSVAAGDVLIRLKTDDQLEAGMQSAQLELLQAQ
jgi:multidrug efflux pump subunit AcrA (membrane-fusion protein)